MYTYKGTEYESLVEFLYEHGIVADWEEKSGAPIVQVKYWNDDKFVAELVYNRGTGEIIEFREQ